MQGDKNEHQDFRVLQQTYPMNSYQRPHDAYREFHSFDVEP